MRKLVMGIGMVLLVWGMGFAVFAEAAPVIAILQENFPQQPSHADPLELRIFLESRHHAVRFISAEELADPQQLQSTQIEIVILPYGSFFPLQARESFIQYLKQGGAFIAMGGYAFDDFMVKNNGVWDRYETDDPRLFLSGRRGKPGDWIQFQPDQIVLFDPTFSFKRVASFDPIPSPLPSGSYWQESLPLEGFPATAMTGNNSPVFGKSYARWYSIVDAQDKYRRPRGSVFGLTFQYDGPYKGSAWAFSGVTNVNLFGSRYPGMLEMLAKTVDAMRARVFLVDIDVRSGAHPDERSVITRFANFGRNESSVELTSSLTPDRESIKRTLQPGEIQSMETSVNVSQWAPCYPFSIELNVPSIFNDRLRGQILKPELMNDGAMNVSFHDNYFRVNEKPTFLMGCNQTGIVWSSMNENPETWEQDFRLMKKYGLTILRVLHFSPFAVEGREGKTNLTSLDLAKRPSDSLIRKTDELVAMCSRHGIALMLTLHDWLPVELTDEELEAQRTWAKFWADRYRNRMNVLFDIQNEPAIQPEISTHVNRLWNEFLAENYQNESKFNEAWGAYAENETWGEISCEPGADEWQNPRFFDFNRFRSGLVERWINKNMEGIKEGNPDALATVGFLQNEWPADKFLPTENLSFSNTHYHGPFERFSPIFKLTDRRFRGQGFSVGEFGAWGAHEARSHGQFKDESEQSVRHFLAVGHETLGMGGSLMMNWDLKDMNECVFPWGLTYMQGGNSMEETVPKDWLDAYGKMSSFFRQLEPVYESPQLFFVIPDNHRFGARSQRIHEALHQALTMLFACHVNFGVMNEKAIAELPPGVKALIWPIPYSPDDEVFEKIVGFVENGGQLYVSGGIGFDPQRRPTRNHRYEQLGFPYQEPSTPFSTDISAEHREFVISSVGRGTVYFMPVPIEMQSFDNLAWNPYKEFLDRIDYPIIQVVPDDPNLHVFSIPETNGNRFYTLFRREKSDSPISYTIRTEKGAFQLALRGMDTGFVEYDSQGKIMAAEGTGEIGWNDSWLFRTDAHIMVRSREKDKDIMDSRFISIFPTRPGTIQFHSKAISSPILEVGYWNSDSMWDQFAIQNPSIDDSVIPFTVDDDMATSMLFLHDKN